MSPPPAPHAGAHRSSGTYEAEEGLGCALPELLPAALSGGPALTSPLSPGCSQSPLWGPPSALPCRSALAAHPEFSSSVSGSPANFCNHPPPSLLPPGPPPISFSQAINLETEMSLLSILWPLFFFFFLHFVLWFFSPFSASVFLSLNVGLPERWCYSVSHFGGRKGSLPAGEDLSC